MAVSIYTSTNSARGFPYLYTLFSIYCLFILVCILIPCPNLSLQVMRHYHIFIHHFHKYLLDVTISFWYQQNLYLLKNTIISSQFYRLAIWAKLIWYNWSTLHVGWGGQLVSLMNSWSANNCLHSHFSSYKEMGKHDPVGEGNWSIEIDTGITRVIEVEQGY